MARDRPLLGTPFGADGPWLNAILDVLADLHDLLDERLPLPEQVGQTKPPVVPISEPAPAGPPSPSEPILKPDPDDPPTEADGGNGPEPADDLPEPPPRAGKGSGLEAWQRWARLAGVDVPDGASRADIITACEDAKVLARE